MRPPTPPKLLLVDDSEANLLALELLFEGMGLVCRRAASGPEALLALEREDFAAVLLDVQMPGLDGYETAALLRRRPRARRTPVLFLTAYGVEHSQLFRGYAVGAVDYLPKPVDPDVLRSKVAVFVELFVKGEELRRQAEALAESNAALEAFAYSVSHDLQAPLRAIRGHAGLLAESCGARLEPAERERLARLTGAAQRLETLTTDLLEYCRVAAAEAPAEAVPLEEALAEARRNLEAPLRETRAALSFEAPLPRVLGHRATLTLALQNLLANAVKFTAPGVRPEVRVRAERRQDKVRLWVEDNGIGVAPADAKRVFRVFERLHPVALYPGSGLGLAIVAKGVERMGGAAGVEPGPDGGSRFWLELPGAA